MVCPREIPLVVGRHTMMMIYLESRFRQGVTHPGEQVHILEHTAGKHHLRPSGLFPNGQALHTGKCTQGVHKLGRKLRRRQVFGNSRNNSPTMGRKSNRLTPSVSSKVTG